MKIVVVGNCQVRPIVTILTEMCTRNTKFAYLVAHLSNESTESQDTLQLADADLIFTQPIDDAYAAGHLSTSRLRDLYKERVVVWPNVFFSGQCPDLVTVTDPTGLVIKGPLETYQLTGVLSAWQRGLSTDNAIAHLKNNLPQEESVLALGTATSLQALKQREAQTDITISDYLESEITSQRLFFTFNHPTAIVLIEICERILRHCNLKFEKRVIAQFWEEPLGRLTYPMTAPVAEFLGVDFSFTDACRGVQIEISDKIVKPGQTTLYSFEEFIEASFRAYDAQLTSDCILRCTPQYLSSHLKESEKRAAA